MIHILIDSNNKNCKWSWKHWLFDCVEDHPIAYQLQCNIHHSVLIFFMFRLHFVYRFWHQPTYSNWNIWILKFTFPTNWQICINTCFGHIDKNNASGCACFGCIVLKYHVHFERFWWNHSLVQLKTFSFQRYFNKYALTRTVGRFKLNMRFENESKRKRKQNDSIQN